MSFLGRDIDPKSWVPKNMKRNDKKWYFDPDLTNSNGLGFYKCILRGHGYMKNSDDLINGVEAFFVVVLNLVECPE